MIHLGSPAVRLLLLASVLAGCNSSSPLVWSAADDVVDEDDDEHVAEEPPPPPPPVHDSGVEDASMDSGVIVMVVTKRPCGTGPGCDPTDMGGETCESLGAGQGRLLCDPATCLFEVGLCDGLPEDASVGRPCGTGPGCTVQDLGGETCGTLGMQSGVLTCDPETCQFDTSLCGPGGGNGGAGATFGGGASGGGTSGTGGGTFFGGGNGTGGSGSFFGGSFFGGGADDADAGL